jgi:ABC-type amino acid transport substrate-binding protein
MVLFSILIFGAVVGLVERRKNIGQFGGGFWSTVGEGVWWSSATISTVGYGDRVPTTKRGRFVGGLWMFIAFAFTSILAGLLSSVLTVARINSQIHTSNDLMRVKCGAVLNSAAFVDGKNMKFDMTSYTTLDDALLALDRGTIGAVLGESVRLRWLMNQPKWENLIMLPTPIVTLYSVFPVSTEVDPQTLDVLNYHLLKITDSKEWEAMRHLFLGDQS